MADNNRKNQGPQNQKPGQQKQQGGQDPNRDKMGQQQDQGQQDQDRMKQGNRQGNQPGVGPDKGDLDKGASEPSDVEDLEGADDTDEEPEDKVTQRNPAQQGRDDQNK